MGENVGDFKRSVLPSDRNISSPIRRLYQLDAIFLQRVNFLETLPAVIMISNIVCSEYKWKS